MSDKFHWGILATGRIARAFAMGLKSVPDAKLVAVGSRSQASADKFADDFDVPHRHDSYRKLVADPDVEAIYVATPHTLHAENSVLCLEAGKAVLCEKPFTINAAQAEKVIATARRRKVFIMEAMWTRFLPVMKRLRELLTEGAIGEPNMLFADFGFRTQFNPKSRLFDPELGGGGLLDVGVYPVSLASMIFGEPTDLVSLARMAPSGVDAQSGFVLRHAAGQLSVLACAVTAQTQQDAVVVGSKGRIHISPSWWKATRMTLYADGKDAQSIELPFEGNGYHYEAVEVMECVCRGKLESDVMPLEETLGVMRTLDRIRAQWGLVYPMETE